MSELVKIPDGDRTPIWFTCSNILAVRACPRNPNKTYIWLKDDVSEDGWLVECPVEHVLTEVSRCG